MLAANFHRSHAPKKTLFDQNRWDSAMPQTRHQQLKLIDIWKQNASQPIHRLIPELISEIFLHARPDVFAMRDAATCKELVSYLVDITSIASYRIVAG